MTSVSDEWEKQALALPTGQKTKIQCCGNSPSAMISNNRWGINYFCFRCETKKSKAHGRRSIAEILEARKAVQELREMRSIPKRCIPLYHPDVPSEAHVWVLKSGLSPEEATDTYGFLYDPKTRRVSLPFVGGFLSRAVFNERPKYVKSGADTEMYSICKLDERLVIVTEDMMSAIKVHKAGYNVTAILGTAVTPTIASALAKFDTVVCWTDGDEAGDAAWVKLRKRMALYPVNLVRVRTDDDPKEFTAAQIRALIGEKLNGN